MTSCIRKYPYDFCFIHNMMYPDALSDILKDGYIKAGIEVPKKYRFLGGHEGSNKIYGQIYFDDLKNTEPWGNASIIIDKSILCDMDVYFHKGWGNLFWTKNQDLKKTDTQKIRKRKIEYIRSFLKDPIEMPEMVRKSFVNLHEVMFDKNISVRKYVKGIIYHSSYEPKIKKIKQIIDKKKYDIWMVPNKGKVLP